MDPCGAWIASRKAAQEVIQTDIAAALQPVAAAAADGTRSYWFGGDGAFDDLIQNLDAPWGHSLLEKQHLQKANAHPLSHGTFHPSELRFTQVAYDYPIGMSGVVVGQFDDRLPSDSPDLAVDPGARRQTRGVGTGPKLADVGSLASPDVRNSRSIIPFSPDMTHP